MKFEPEFTESLTTSRSFLSSLQTRICWSLMWVCLVFLHNLVFYWYTFMTFLKFLLFCSWFWWLDFVKVISLNYSAQPMQFQPSILYSRLYSKENCKIFSILQLTCLKMRIWSWSIRSNMTSSNIKPFSSMETLETHRIRAVWYTGIVFAYHQIQTYLSWGVVYT